MHLTEVLIAAALLVTVSVSLPPAFAGAVRANLAAADTTRTVVLAAQKMEEIRSLPFASGGIDQAFDLLDDRGRVVEGPGSAAAYARMWRAEPLPLAPDDTIVITVVVSPHSRSNASSSNRLLPGATRLVTLRTRKAS